MATVIEKDVLIEVIATAMAEIFRYQEKYGEESIDKSDDDTLIEKRQWVYCTANKDIDYQRELKAIQEIRDKYNKL